METSLALCPLFAGIPTAQLPELIRTLGGHTRAYPAMSTLLLMEEPVTELGVLLSGNARALMSTPQGKLLLVNRLAASDVFADVLAVGRDARSPVSIEAEDDCRVLWLPIRRLLEDSPAHPLGHLLLRNLTASLSARYFAMQRRLLCLTQGSLREKILFYLAQEQAAARTAQFSIPLDRASLAHYLGAERSALCRELSRMQREGLIAYRKNLFTLYPQS